MVLSCATVLSSSVCKYSHKRNTILVIHGDYPVIKHICSHQCHFAIVELNGSHLGIGVDKSLLINTTNTFDITHIVRILSTEITRMVGFNFSFGYFFFLSLLSATTCASVSTKPFCAALASSASVAS